MPAIRVRPKTPAGSTQQSSLTPIFQALLAGWEVSLAILIPILGFLLLGLWLDRTLLTAPLFLLIGMILGLVFAIAGLYSFVRPFLREKSEEKPPAHA